MVGLVARRTIAAWILLSSLFAFAVPGTAQKRGRFTPDRRLLPRPAQAGSSGVVAQPGTVTMPGSLDRDAQEPGQVASPGSIPRTTSLAQPSTLRTLGTRDALPEPDRFGPLAAALVPCAQCDLLYASDCGTGLWSIDTTTLVSTFIGDMGQNMFDIALDMDGRLFGVTGFGSIFELSTCDASLRSLPVFVSGNGLAGDLGSNDLFSQGPPLQRIDTTAATVTTVGGTPGPGSPFWCGPSSGDLALLPTAPFLYSTLSCPACGGGDMLVLVEPATGDVVLEIGCVVDPVTGPVGAIFGLAIDSAERLWGVTGFTAPEVLLIDRSTAVATRVSVTGGFDCAFGLAALPCAEAVPPGDCSPLTQGFWKRVCERTHPSGEHESLPGYVSCVSAAATFRGVSDVDAACERLHPEPDSDKCEQAEAQFMALTMNVCSTRLGEDCCVEIPGESVTTVGEAVDVVDGLLSNPARTFRDCVRAQAIADAINTAAALCD
jgi:hypothetical protein